MLKTIVNTSWPKMFLIAGGLGTATGFMGLLAHRQREKLLEGNPFLKKSLEMIKQREILDLLGTDEPDFSRPSLSHPWSKIDDHRINLIVNIKGTKDKAKMFVIAEREDIKDKYHVTKIVLEFKKIKDKKLVVFDHSLQDILAEENKKQSSNV